MTQGEFLVFLSKTIDLQRSKAKRARKKSDYGRSQYHDGAADAFAKIWEMAVEGEIKIAEVPNEA